MQKEKLTRLTLAEALSSGRPFKHESWNHFPNKNGPKFEEFYINQSLYEPVGEIQPEEQPPMRVWNMKSENCSSSSMILGECIPDGERWKECTKQLAVALAPHLKELLK